jgi:hypothetical protein
LKSYAEGALLVQAKDRFELRDGLAMLKPEEAAVLELKFALKESVEHPNLVQ